MRRAASDPATLASILAWLLRSPFSSIGQAPDDFSFLWPDPSRFSASNFWICCSCLGLCQGALVFLRRCSVQSLWSRGSFQLKDRTVPGSDFQLPFTGVCALLRACLTSSIWFSIPVHLASGCSSQTSSLRQDSHAGTVSFSRFSSSVRWFWNRFLSSVGASTDCC
jgi:hypothetical protein